VVALYDWLAFYHKEYKTVGTVTGRFYDESGKPTKALLQARAALAEGQRIKAQSEAEKARYPACNSEWSAARGGRVWCSSKRWAEYLTASYPDIAHPCKEMLFIS
uniref:Cytochrome b5 heme-binding domain-containing protein n=1 Tax=Oryzias melastigma TaxID=30732 RepID=A0A3B3DC79_ORYME